MAKHAKHAAPPRRRRSAQKHTSHKGVTLYTLGVLLVAVSVLLSAPLAPPQRGCSSSGSGGGVPCCFGGTCCA